MRKILKAIIEKVKAKAAFLVKIAVFFIFFSFLMMSAFYNLGETDYFLHLKNGEYILEQRIIPSADVFSFTVPGKPWVDHEWLYQVGLAGVYKLGGLEALFLVKVAIFSLAFFLLAAFLLRTDWVFAYPLLFYGLHISVRRFTLRPDNLSFLFLIFFLAPFVFRRRKLLYLLPLAQLVWVNVHGFFFLGPFILLLYVLLSPLTKKDVDPAFYKTARVALFLTLAACFVSPHPLATVVYPLRMVKEIAAGSHAVFYEHIQELHSAFSAYPERAYFIGYLVLAFLCFFFPGNLNIFYIGLWAAFAFFSSNALRNIYFFVPVAVAIFSNRYPYIRGFLRAHIFHEKGWILLRFCFLVMVIVFSVKLAQDIARLPQYGRSYFTKDLNVVVKGNFLSFDFQTHPQEMFDFIAAAELPERMYNSFNIGAPLVFSFFPERKVFIDGRTELYGQDFFSRYISATDGDTAAFTELLKAYSLQGFLISYLREAPPLLIKIAVDKGFRCVYFGGDGIIFVAEDYFEKTPSLHSFAVDFSTLSPPPIDFLGTVKEHKPSVKGHFNMAYCLYMLGYHQQSRQYLSQVLALKPDDSLSYYYLADMSYQEGDFLEAYRNCRMSLSLKPSSAIAYKLLAKVYYRTGYLDDARRITERYGVDFDAFSQEVDNE